MHILVIQAVQPAVITNNPAETKQESYQLYQLILQGVEIIQEHKFDEYSADRL